MERVYRAIFTPHAGTIRRSIAVWQPGLGRSEVEKIKLIDLVGVLTRRTCSGLSVRVACQRVRLVRWIDNEPVGK